MGHQSSQIFWKGSSSCVPRKLLILGISGQCKPGCHVHDVATLLCSWGKAKADVSFLSHCSVSWTPRR